MDSTFQKINLGRIAEFRNGLNYSKEDVGKGLKVIGVTDFQDRIYPLYNELEEVNPDGISISDEQFLKENDILFVRSNGNRELVGRTLIIKNIREKISHSGFTIRLRFTENEVNPSFFLYVFKSPQFRKQIANYGGGTNISNINQSILNDIEIPNPEIEVQNRIASILSAFDDLIENNTRRIAILEEMARLIYREWFVHYRYPGHENDKMVDSGPDLGEVPEGWELKELGDLFEVKSGYAFKSKNLSDNGKYGIVKIKNVTDEGVDVDNVDYHEGPIPDRGKKFKLSNGDVLLTMTGYIGRVARMPKTEKTYYVNQRVGKLFSKDHSELIHFIYELLKSEEYQSKMNNLAYGAAQPNISSKNLHGMQVVKPSKNVIEQFNQFVVPIYNEIDLLLQKNRKLKETRDLLLPKLISGKVEVLNEQY